MASKANVIILDDHPLFRNGLKAIIGRDLNYRVVGEAGNSKDGIALIKKFKPDIVTIDIPLPDDDSIKIIHNIKEIVPDTSIMVISMNFESNYIYESFNAGAKGYMVKSSAAENLMDGFRVLIKGDFYLDHRIAQHVVKYMIKSSKRLIQISDTKYEKLTAKEQEITRMLAYGFSDGEIADKLGFNLNVVKDCHENIFEKLGIHNTMELMRYAAMIGLVDTEIWNDFNSNNPESRIK